MSRRIRSTGAPSFSLQLPAPEQSLLTAPLQSTVCAPENLFIEFDTAAISPAMAIGNGAASFEIPAGSDPFNMGSERPLAGPRRFVKVDDSNLYVFFGDQTQAPAYEQPSAEPVGSPDFLSLDGAGTASSASFSGDVAYSVGAGGGGAPGPGTSSGGGGGGGGDSVVNESIRYEDLIFKAFIGAGQQGAVYEVEHKGRLYAVKKISVEDAFTATLPVERQARKAAIVRELTMVANRTNQCSYLVNLHNAYFKKKELLILMERMSCSLEDLVKDISRMPYSEVRRIMQQKCTSSKPRGTPVRKPELVSFDRAADLEVESSTPCPELMVSVIVHDLLKGLVHLHDVLRLAHTDLKLANVLLSMNQEIFKIADFGSSCELDAKGRVTFNGVNLGAKLYMSPERVKGIYMGEGTSFDAKSDIWTLGIIVLELATGCHPCRGIADDFWNFGERLRFENLVKPQSCSEHLIDFCRQCLHRDPARRPAARELLRHDFLRHYEGVSRRRFSEFLRAVRAESRVYWKRVRENELRSHVTAACTLDRDHARESQQKWGKYASAKGYGMKPVPSVDDRRSFPALS